MHSLTSALNMDTLLQGGGGREGEGNNLMRWNESAVVAYSPIFHALVTNGGGGTVVFTVFGYHVIINFEDQYTCCKTLWDQ